MNNPDSWSGSSHQPDAAIAAPVAGDRDVAAVGGNGSIAIDIHAWTCTAGAIDGNRAREPGRDIGYLDKNAAGAVPVTFTLPPLEEMEELALERPPL